MQSRWFAQCARVVAHARANHGCAPHVYIRGMASTASKKKKQEEAQAAKELRNMMLTMHDRQANNESYIAMVRQGYESELESTVSEMEEQNFSQRDIKEYLETVMDDPCAFKRWEISEMTDKEVLAEYKEYEEHQLGKMEDAKLNLQKLKERVAKDAANDDLIKPEVMDVVKEIVEDKEKAVTYYQQQIQSGAPLAPDEIKDYMEKLGETVSTEEAEAISKEFENFTVDDFQNSMKDLLKAVEEAGLGGDLTNVQGMNTAASNMKIDWHDHAPGAAETAKVMDGMGDMKFPPGFMKTGTKGTAPQGDKPAKSHVANSRKNRGRR